MIFFGLTGPWALGGQGFTTSHLQMPVTTQIRSEGICPRCQQRPADKVLLGKEGEGHICGECWKQDRVAADLK